MLQKLRGLGKLSSASRLATTYHFGLSSFNFSARLKLAKLQKTAPVSVGGLGTPRKTQTHAKFTSERSQGTQIDLLEQSEAAIAQTPGLFKEPEAEPAPVPNYLENDQMLKNDMHTINYKSRLSPCLILILQILHFCIF